MTGFKLQSFNGQLPKIDDRLLPDDFAAYALNTSLASGILRGISQPQLLADLSHRVETVRKVWRLDDDGKDFWFGLSDPDADLVKAPLVNDAFDRYYWTQAGFPPQYSTLARMKSGQLPYSLGIPGPQFAPTLTVTGGGLDEEGAPDPNAEEETRGYVFTFVSIYGEEGQPSPPVTGEGFPDGTWTLGNLNQMPINAETKDIDRIRIYRTVVGASGSPIFIMVDELPLGTATYDDTKTDEEIIDNSILPSTEWAMPPDGLQGLLVAAGGFLVGFKGRDLYFSEPYRPHAWPASYVLTMEWPIVGLGQLGNTVVVMTQGAPQAATGVHPSAMTLEKTNTPEPCLHKGSIVNAPEGVYYAGASGLMLIAGSGPQNVLQNVVDREDWITRYNPTKIRAARHKTGYIALTGTGQGFRVQLAEERAAFSEFVNIEHTINVQNDYRTGDCYLISQNKVFKWDPGMPPRLVGLWRSKEFSFPYPVNLSALLMKLDFEDTPAPPTIGTEASPDNELGPAHIFPVPSPVPQGELPTVPEGQRARLRIWADRRLVYDQFVNDNHERRLTHGFKADIWQFELAVRSSVYSIHCAETVKELRSG